MKKCAIIMERRGRGWQLRITAFFMAFAAMIAFSGCADKSIRTKLTQTFDDANYYYAKGRYESARQRYEKILEEQPDSPFRIHVLLAKADTYYMGKEFMLSAPEYRKFAELYPLDPLTPRAHFYEGMSYFRDMFGVKRDQANAKKALETFKSFLEKYPDNAAAPAAREKVKLLNDRLAEKIYRLVDFYCGISAWGACIGRVDELLEKYPNTRFKASALIYKAEAYLGEEAFEKSRNTFKRIIEEHPNTDEAQKARTGLQEAIR